MSDSESQDSDEGIRYKTQSVRNKLNITDFPKRGSRSSYHKDKVRIKNRKKSRSPILKEKHSKKREKKRSSSRSSNTSSSDDKSKKKIAKKESKQEDKTNCQHIESQLQTETISLLLKDQERAIQNEVIGPALPPHLLSKMNKNPLIDYYLERKEIIKDNLPSLPSIGPKLPPHMNNITKPDSYEGPTFQTCLSNNTVAERYQETLKDTNHPQLPSYIGPQLPSCLLNNRKYNELQENPESTQQNVSPQSVTLTTATRPSEESNKEKIIGPSLPPHLQKNTSEEIKDFCLESNMLGEEQISKHAFKTIGPNLPPHLRQKLQEEVEDSDLVHNTPAEDEDVYGPLPAGESNYSLSHKALEERALQLKIDQLEPKGSSEPIRESWMIELPTAKAANFGLGPRQFRNKSGPDLSDRSSWTDLPGDKNKKKSGDIPVDLKAEAELNQLRKRDEEQERLTKKHKRKEKSLVKMHKEKLEKEKKDEKTAERRPFSRDIDLQANRFDEAQKQAIIKKAQLLDDRFSSGKSKFL